MSNKMEALGMVELSSIGVAYAVRDAMIKAADVQVLVARTICSGKYMIMIGGPVQAVRFSLEAGRACSDEALIDELLIPAVDMRIFPAIAASVELEDSDRQALGVLEAFSVTAIVEGADAAVKAADVKLFRIHVAMAIGGKGYLLLTGEISQVQAGIAAGAAEIAKRGLLVSKVVIPNPEPELFTDVL